MYNVMQIGIFLIEISNSGGFLSIIKPANLTNYEHFNAGKCVSTVSSQRRVCLNLPFCLHTQHVGDPYCNNCYQRCFGPDGFRQGCVEPRKVKMNDDEQTASEKLGQHPLCVCVCDLHVYVLHVHVHVYTYYI